MIDSLSTLDVMIPIFLYFFGNRNITFKYLNILLQIKTATSIMKIPTYKLLVAINQGQIEPCHQQGRYDGQNTEHGYSM